MSRSVPQYKINWLDLSYLGYHESVGVASLPGSRHRFVERDFEQDKAAILDSGVHHVFVLCETGELQRFGVGNILDYCNTENNEGFQVYHYPTEVGMFVEIPLLLEIIRKVFHILEQGDKCIIVSRDGLGRSCVVGATLFLQTDDNVTPAGAYDLIKTYCGPRAVQTIKQYNFLVDFRSLRDEHNAAMEEHDHERHISR